MKAGGKLPLYEAIELRSEMDARIKTMESLRPEREDRSLFRERDAEVQPAADFDLTAVEAEVDPLTGGSTFCFFSFKIYERIIPSVYNTAPLSF